MDFNIKRRLTDFPLSRQLRILIGTFLMRVHPEKVRQVDAAPHSKDWGAAGKLIRNGLYYRALRSRDFDTLGRYLAEYWSADANCDFHELFAERFDNHFLLRDARLAGEVEKIARSTPCYQLLCEMGCGNGLVLDYYRQHIGGFERYMGLDLSTSQITKNRDHYGDKMEFVAMDAASWISDCRAQGVVFLTNGGVFECLIPGEVRQIIELARDRLAPVAFAIVENIASNHDITIDKESRVYGREFSFSHNYRYLFQAAGYRIRFLHEYTAKGERWINMLAEFPRDSRKPACQ